MKTMIMPVHLGNSYILTADSIWKIRANYIELILILILPAFLCLMKNMKNYPLKRIFLDSIKDADTINVNKYNYFLF